MKLISKKRSPRTQPRFTLPIFANPLQPTPTRQFQQLTKKQTSRPAAKRAHLKISLKVRLKFFLKNCPLESKKPLIFAY
jgi:hypothetical protein